MQPRDHGSGAAVAGSHRCSCAWQLPQVPSCVAVPLLYATKSQSGCCISRAINRGICLQRAPGKASRSGTLTLGKQNLEPIHNWMSLSSPKGTSRLNEDRCLCGEPLTFRAPSHLQHGNMKKEHTFPIPGERTCLGPTSCPSWFSSI